MNLKVIGLKTNMPTKPFPIQVREIITSAIYNSSMKYEMLSQYDQGTIDKHVQSIVDAAVGCVDMSHIAYEPQETYMAKEEIRAQLQGEERV